jgi:hypothetical protein
LSRPIGLLTLGWLVLIMVCGSVWGSLLPSAEKKKIEILIGGVEQMTDAVFLRNGKSYRSRLLVRK